MTWNLIILRKINTCKAENNERGKNLPRAVKDVGFGKVSGNPKIIFPFNFDNLDYIIQRFLLAYWDYVIFFMRNGVFFWMEIDPNKMNNHTNELV